MRGSAHRAGGRNVGTLLGLACLLAAPFAAHAALVSHRGTAFAGALIAVQAALIGWISLSLAAPPALRRGQGRWLGIRLAVCACLAGLTLLIWQRADAGLMLAAAVPHAVAYLGLLTLFAASLRPGREPIITAVARHARGKLSDALLHYTRCVTIAWCGFFAAQLAASFMLWLLAPLAWWSVFVNLGTLPLVALMFGAELAYRHRRHGIHLPDIHPATNWERPRRILHAIGHNFGQLRSPMRQTDP